MENNQPNDQASSISSTSSTSNSPMVGRVNKGMIQEKVKTKTGQDTFLRLSDVQLAIAPNTQLLKVQKDKRDYSVLADQLSFEAVLDHMSGSDGEDKIAGFYLDLVNEARRQYFAHNIRTNPEVSYIDFGLDNVVQWSMEETKRGRAAQGFSGEQWKAFSQMVMVAAIGYIKAEKGIEVSVAQLSGLMGQLKLVCTVGQAIPTDKLLATMVGIGKQLGESELADLFRTVTEVKTKMLEVDSLELF